MTFFQRLVSESEAERNYLLSSRQIQDGLRGQISLETYISYLTEAYHHVKHTVPLLRAARMRLGDRQKWMEPAIKEYIEEESGHELWILDDIRCSGGDAEAARNGISRPETEFMVSYAYDFINRINPVGFFGMVFVLEGTSTQLATKGAQAIQSSLRLGDDCFHYLRSHGAVDIEHMQFFESVMNNVEDREDQEAIIHVARRIYILFANMFRAIPHDRGARHAA
jgi:pyrroloquinoline quinone (PQQ) biosynthesis protein C